MKSREEFQTSKDDEAYQNEILQHVSRTFALTIPELPDPLNKVVANAYLLCRIADTIEDDKSMAAESGLAFDHLSELVADLHTLDAQMASPRPKTGIIRETLLSIQSVLE